jgi:hypothetical protein
MTYKIEYEGQTVTLPNFVDIPVGLVRKARHENEGAQLFAVLEGILSEKDLEVMDSLPMGEFNRTTREWAGGASLGES